MTDERAPEAPRDERLLPRSVVAQASAKVEEWVRRIHLHDPHGALSVTERGLLHANISMLLDHEAAQADHIDALTAENARLRTALECAAVHLQIGVNRMRGCHAETGMHELLVESEEFVAEARAALTGRADGEA